MRIFGVIGWKNSGKTGLMVRLISEITARGFSVSTIKHAHHSFQLSLTSPDGHERMASAAHETVFSSATRWSQVRRNTTGSEVPFADLLAQLRPVDLILVEGYKLEGHPKIEAHRTETNRDPIASTDNSILAIAATGRPQVEALPILDLNDTVEIADFILDHVGLPLERTGALPDCGGTTITSP